MIVVLGDFFDPQALPLSAFGKKDGFFVAAGGQSSGLGLRVADSGWERCYLMAGLKGFWRLS